MNKPDIKDYFPKDTAVTDVVKSALDNPWYKYAGKLDRYIDELLEKIESSPLKRRYSTEEIIKELKDCDHIDDAIAFFNNAS